MRPDAAVGGRPDPAAAEPDPVDGGRVELLPPTRSASVNWPVRGLARRKTPAPAYAVPPVLASPEAYQSEPSAARVRSPEESVGSWSLIDTQWPPPDSERQMPPSAEAA